jgi:enoyl-CoA hydratase/carnithine racemase
MSGVVLSDRQARVRWITINRPERHNALDRQTILALRDAVAAATRS